MKMKSVLLATVALSVLATVASAADLAPRYTKAPLMADPASNWTGFYLGLNAGAADSKGNLDAITLYNGLQYPTYYGASNSFHNLSGLAGGQIGYNYQLGNAVLGLEADAQWMNTHSSMNLYVDPFFGGKGAYGSKLSQSVDWLATVRGRAGIAASPSLLLYATAGLAIAGTKVKYSSSFDGLDQSADKTKFGWVAGFGAEYALGGNWSVKAEYLRVGLQDSNLDVPLSTYYGPGYTGNVKVQQDLDIIRAGVNYKFQ
jgi:outer membrane immunogenic protein